MASTYYLVLQDSDAETRLWLERMFELAEKLGKTIELEIYLNNHYAI